MFRGVSPGINYILMFNFAIFQEVIKLVVVEDPSEFNKNQTRYNSMQIFIYCKVTLHVLGVTAPIIRSTKNCNRSLRYRS